VEADQLADVAGAQALQEPAERRGVGEPGQAHNALEGAVVLEDLGGVDAVEPHDDAVEQCQQHVGGVVVPVSRPRAQRMLEQPLEAEARAEGMDQRHLGEVGKLGFVESDVQISEPFGHCP